jgi:succinoglycan biosynthesis transport protein ExoP
MEPEKDIRHYLAVLKSRKKYFYIPMVAVFLTAVAVAVLLPSIYESTSTILIEQQQIPPDFVRPTVTGYADQRIQSLTQQILSRTKLWEVIQQFNLYPDLREKLTREELLEKMRDDIRIDTISAEIAGGPGPSKTKAAPPGAQGMTIAFSISYRGRNPDTVQKVAGSLASQYLEQNLKTREEQAKTTTRFLEAELKELQENIRVLGDKLSKFKQEYEGVTPDLYQFNLGQAERLETEVKQMDTAIRAAEDRKIYLEGQVATIKPDTPIIGATGERVMDPQTRLRALEVILADLQSKFSDDHPDIRKVKREMAELKKIVGQRGGSASVQRQKLTQLQAELAQKQGRYSDEHPEVKKLKNEIALLEKSPDKAAGSAKPMADAENPAYISLMAQIQGAANDIASLQKQRAILKEKAQMYRQRLETTPKVEQEYLALARDYNNAHAKHQEVMNKILEARISEGMEEHQKGEKFTLIDPASYPETPVSPQRWLIILAGAIMSLFAGFGTVALADHLDHSVKSYEELARLTGLPVLGSITRIWTKEDAIRAQHRRKLIWAITCLSLVTALLLFHFLYMDLWVLTARLLRLASRYS